MMSFRKHDTASVDPNCMIGPGSSLGAYSVVAAGVSLGNDCKVGDHVILAGSVTVGREVEMDSGVYLGESTKVGDRVQIGPRATLDSRKDKPIEVREGAVIGAQATIQAGVVIGNHAVVEPGAVVTRNVPATAFVAGNPAKIVRYAATRSAPIVPHPDGETSAVVKTQVRGVDIHRLPMIEDLRGNLSFGEAQRHIPFEVKRYFLTFGVASEEARGEHAHLTLKQFLICVHGRLHIMADDGRHREEFILDRPDLALYLPPMVWAVQYRFSPGAVLLVFCSDFYDPADYIRDYATFQAMSGAADSGSDDLE